MNLEEVTECIKKLEELTEIQCKHGNWDYDPYMHGMANGMLFALALFKHDRPEYLKPPEKWLKDNKGEDYEYTD